MGRRVNYMPRRAASTDIGVVYSWYSYNNQLIITYSKVILV